MTDLCTASSVVSSTISSAVLISMMCSLSGIQCKLSRTSACQPREAAAESRGRSSANLQPSSSHQWMLAHKMNGCLQLQNSGITPSSTTLLTRCCSSGGLCLDMHLFTTCPPAHLTFPSPKTILVELEGITGISDCLTLAYIYIAYAAFRSGSGQLHASAADP
jgi:hypothetical protein